MEQAGHRSRQENDNSTKFTELHDVYKNDLTDHIENRCHKHNNMDSASDTCSTTVSTSPYDYPSVRYDESLNACEFGTTAEQLCEAEYDTRLNSDNDLLKNRIDFSNDKLYGRDQELAKMHAIYDMISGGKQVERQVNIEVQSSERSSMQKQQQDDSLHPSKSTSHILFLSGFSGIGKSALVDEFVKQTTKKQKQQHRSGPLYICGKYEESKTADPFSAVTASIGHLASQLLDASTKNKAKELEHYQTRLREANIECGTEDGKVLIALVPKIKMVLAQKQEISTDERNQNCAMTKSLERDNCEFARVVFHDVNTIQQSLQKLIKALCTQSRPMIMFIDDLQWADEASLKLLTSLLKDKSLHNFLFIGSYRSNEVNEDHSFHKLMKTMLSKDDAKTKPQNNVHQLELFNLSPNHISEFIADSIDRSIDEIATIADVVYSKTLGNIFFVMQALEELVRKNALYYDVMCFQWQWANDLSRMDLEKYLSDDVVKMVQSKISTLPELLQKSLFLAAYTRNTIELDILLLLVQETQGKDAIDYHRLASLMDLAVFHGIMLSSSGKGDAKKKEKKKTNTNGSLSRNKRTTIYTFAHDLIREAACLIEKEGESKNTLLVGIANVLLNCVDNQSTASNEERKCFNSRNTYKDETNDWMLFVAVDHLNSVPAKYTDCHTLAELNYRVGKIASSKAAFDEAVVLLQNAVNVINNHKTDDYYWNDNSDNASGESRYQFILNLYNLLAETQLTLGQFDAAINTANIAVANAKCSRDKCAANTTYIMAYCNKIGNDYNLATAKAVEILAQHHGIQLNPKPTNQEVMIGWMKVKKALKMGSLMKLVKLPITNDSAEMKLLLTIQRTVMFAPEYRNFGKMIIYKMIRIALAKNCITPEVAIVGLLGIFLQDEGKLKEAYSYASVGNAILQRFESIAMGSSDQKLPKGAVMLKMGLNAAVIPLRMEYCDIMGIYFDLHKELINIGNPDSGLAAGMLAVLSYFSAGIPLKSLLEPKLHLLENISQSLSRQGFVNIFQYQRQFLYNLQGCKYNLRQQSNPDNPTLLVGDAFDEVKILGSLKDGSNAKKMTLRDISMLRLHLAFIFDDEAVMGEMLTILESYPIRDSSLVRQHLRMTYMGLAAFELLKRSKTKSIKHQSKAEQQNNTNEKNDIYQKCGQASFKLFKDMAKFGSPNAQPVYLCLKAMKAASEEIHKNSKSTVQNTFDKAISHCLEVHLLHLAAMMNERCAYYLLAPSSNEISSKSNFGGSAAGKNDINDAINQSIANGTNLNDVALGSKTCVQDTNAGKSPLEAASAAKYLKCAMWLYQDWGAMAKVSQLQSKYNFLNQAQRNKAPSRVSAIRQRANESIRSSKAKTTAETAQIF